MASGTGVVVAHSIQQVIQIDPEHSHHKCSLLHQNNASVKYKGWKDKSRWMDGRKDGRMDASMNRLIEKSMEGRMDK